MMLAEESAACALLSGTTDTRAIRVSTAAGSNRPKPASVASVLRTSSSASPDSFCERGLVARLEIDQRDIVPRIGEHDRDAAPHAPRAEAGDRFLHRTPSASIVWIALRSIGKPERLQRASRLHEILAAHRAADRQECARERRRHAGEFAA